MNNEYSISSKIFLSSFFLYSKLITTKSKCIDVYLLLQNDVLICIFLFSFCKRRCKIFFFCNIHLPACLSDTQFSDNICIKPYKIFRKIRKVEIILKINQQSKACNESSISYFFQLWSQFFIEHFYIASKSFIFTKDTLSYKLQSYNLIYVIRNWLKIDQSSLFFFKLIFVSIPNKSMSKKLKYLSLVSP